MGCAADAPQENGMPTTGEKAPTTEQLLVGNASASGKDRKWRHMVLVLLAKGYIITRVLLNKIKSETLRVKSNTCRCFFGLTSILDLLFLMWMLRNMDVKVRHDPKSRL